MALRILKGNLAPISGNETNGQAIIYFNPHQVTGDADGFDMVEFGEWGDFNNPPITLVSLKEILVVHTFEQFRINDGYPSSTQVEVEWDASPGSQIRAMSYMIIGEV